LGQSPETATKSTEAKTAEEDTSLRDSKREEAKKPKTLLDFFGGE